MADVIVARLLICCHGYVAHGTYKLVISLGIGLYMMYTALGLRPYC